MSEFCELKIECEKLLSEVKKRKQALCVDIIHDDMNRLRLYYKERLTQSEKGMWFIDKDIKLQITDGDLDIIDDRGTAFGWLFEVEIEGVSDGDYFVIDNQLYSVADLDENTLKDGEEYIMNVIEILKRSIEHIGHENDFEYSYYSDHEDIRCRDIFEVIKAVLDRKPVKL